MGLFSQLQNLGVRKTADQSVTSSTTLVDDNELTFTVAPGGYYFFEVYAEITCATAGGVKVGINAPSATNFFCRTFLTDNATALGVGGQLDTALPVSYGAGTNGTTAFVKMEGFILDSGSGGTFNFRFAQNASNGTATTVKAGSYLFFSQLA